VSGLTPTGFVAKTVEEIIADMQARQRSSIDGSLNTSATSVIGALNTSFALELAQCWEALGEVYDAHDPNSAQGIAADHNGALSGETRLDHTKSTVTLSLTMDAGTTVIAGSVVSMLGAPSIRFVTLSDAITLGVPATIDVRAEAEDFGAIYAGAGTLTHIESPTSGWTDVTNAAPTTIGSDVETDEAYRVRRIQEISSQGGSTTSGIVADLRKLTPLVREVQAIENDTDSTVDGLPPHSFEIVVWYVGVDPADAATIAASIWKNKPAGVQSVGTELVVVTDSEGLDHDVYFTRPTLVPINVNYDATTDATYAAHGVRDALVAAYADSTSPAYFSVGKDVSLLQLLVAGSRTIGVLNLTLDIARDPALPTGAVPASPADTIAIGPRELATFVGANWVGP
jgi:hypothetical protein